MCAGISAVCAFIHPWKPFDGGIARPTGREATTLHILEAVTIGQGDGRAIGIECSLQPVAVGIVAANSPHAGHIAMRGFQALQGVWVGYRTFNGSIVGLIGLSVLDFPILSFG